MQPLRQPKPAAASMRCVLLRDVMLRPIATLLSIIAAAARDRSASVGRSVGRSVDRSSDCHLPLSAESARWPLQRTIQHLKARGIRRVFVATGAMDADASAACAQADGVATDKVPADLAPYLKLTR